MSFHDRLTAVGKTHLYKDYGNGCHTFANFTRQTVDTLAQFEKLLANPLPAPTTFDYRTIDPAFDIWGWHIATDPARALEFLRVEGSRDHLKLTGSGATTVSRAFPGLALVDVDGVPTPVRGGRLQVRVDLGPPNTTQQYTAGAAAPVTATKELVLAPHAVVKIGRVTRVAAGLRVCVRALGGHVTRARISSGGRSRVVAIGARTRCRTLATAHAGTVTVQGHDGFGHPVRASKQLRGPDAHGRDRADT